MKILFLLMLAAVVASPTKCNKDKSTPGCYKGRLQIKALCSNYTIALLEGNLDSTVIAPSWTDENTGKAYQNVFALGSPCSFPSTINEGDEFYFMLAEPDENCAVCQAYYPVPPKKLAIKVLDKPCP